MRKIISLLITMCLIVLLCSCNSNPDSNPQNTSSPSSSNTATNDPDTNIEANTPSSNTTDPTPNTNIPSEIDKEYMLAIIESVYENAEGSVYKGYYLSDLKDEMIKQGAISEKSSARYFGTSLEYVFAVYSESNQEAVAFSMCLLRAKDDANVEQIKTAIRDNANPNKWECVTAEKVVVESNGKYVILIMADTAEADSLRTAFLSLNLN